MVNRAVKVVLFSILFFVLTNAAFAQNTKGDPSKSRESRFSVKKERPKRVKSKRSSTLRAYKPRKQAKGGERAGRPVAPLRNDPPGDKVQNVYPQSGRFVNNQSESGGSSRQGGSAFGKKRVTARTSARSTRNVYPQSGRFVNHSSTSQKPPRHRRVVPRTATRSYIARRMGNNWQRFPSQRRKKEKAYTGDIAGKPLRTKNFQSQKPGVIPANPAGRRSVSARLKQSATRSVRFSGARSRTERNVYPKSTKFQNNPSRRARTVERAASNQEVRGKLNRLQSKNERRRPKRTKVVPRSASGAYIARKSPNMWARFPRPKRKGERATTKDLAGHPLDKKNYHTPQQEVIPAYKPYYGRKRVGDQPYQARGRRYSTATRPGKAWRGDITGRNVRGRNYRSKIPSVGYPPLPLRPKMRAKGIDKYQGDIRGRKGFRDQGERYSGNLRARKPLKGGGSISGARWNNQGKPILGKQPGMGMFGLARYRGFMKGKKGFTPQGEEYTGNIKSRKPMRGGGSVSGRLWNNQGRAVASKVPGVGARGIDKYQGTLRGRKGFSPQGEEYTGNIKARRPLTGGGSVSGKLWNNNQRAVAGKVPGIGARGIDKYQGTLRGRKGFSNQGEEYTGNIKARRPLKGGGSISGRLWNNNQRAIAGKVPGIGAKGIEEYSGNIRGRKGFSNQGEEYTGNIKARKPLKGGGSVSGKLWNNNQRAIAAKVPGIGAKGIDTYQGNLRGRKGFSNQGEEYTGNIKARKPLKGGGSVSGKLWNNREMPIAGKEPGIGAKGVDTYSGNVKVKQKGPSSNDKTMLGFAGNIKRGQRGFNDQGEEYVGPMKAKKYVQNPNANEASLKKVKPTPNTYQTAGLQIRVKQPLHGKRKGAPDGALAVLKPGKSSIQAAEFSRAMKQRWGYVKNPNAADESLKTREPGKAFARLTDYQGNIKMKKFDLFGRRDLHPDAQFMKTNRNNVADEKDVLTNFRLWWARLFKKNDTQPDHLKEKTRKPRYDKREVGLWYD
jgi:hypothetical protein